MSTSLRSAPDMRAMVDPLTLTTFVPGAILHAAELNGSFDSMLPKTGGTIDAPDGPIKALTILTGDNGVTCNNGLEVIQGYNGGGLGMGPGLVPHTASVRFGAETFHDHFAAVFNTALRATGAYGNLESVLTIPAGATTANLSNAFTASVHDYGGNGAQAINTYAIAGANNATLWGIQTVCTDSSPATSGMFTGVREQIEFDYFVRNTSTTVRGVLCNLSSNVVSPTGQTWIAFTTGLFPASQPWDIAYSSGNGTAQTALLVGSAGPYGAPVETGDKSQLIQFLYTDNTTPTTNRAVSIYADPTYAGATGVDLRISSTQFPGAKPHLTLDNLAYFKALNGAANNTLALMTLNGLDQLCIGDGVASTFIRAGISAAICASAQFTSVANGINEVLFTGAASGSAPVISSYRAQGGTDSSIGLTINPFGLGVLSLNALGTNTVVGTGAAIATNAVFGHLQIPTCAGPPTGAIGGAGKAALIADSTNHKLYFNDGSGWLAVN